MKGGTLLSLRRLGSALDRASRAVDTVGSVISALFILVLMLLITADVVGRYALNSPLPGALEVSESLMVFVVFLAFAWAQRHGKNIRVEMAISRFPPWARSLVDILAIVLGLVVFSLIAWETWRSGLSSWRVREYMTGAVKFPLYPSKLVVPLGSALLCAQYLVDLSRHIGRLARPEGGLPRSR